MSEAGGEIRWTRKLSEPFVIESVLMPYGVALNIEGDQDWLIAYLNALEAKLKKAQAMAEMIASHAGYYTPDMADTGPDYIDFLPTEAEAALIRSTLAALKE